MKTGSTTKRSIGSSLFQFFLSLTPNFSKCVREVGIIELVTRIMSSGMIPFAVFAGCLNFLHASQPRWVVLLQPEALGVGQAKHQLAPLLTMLWDDSQPALVFWHTSMRVSTLAMTPATETKDIFLLCSFFLISFNVHIDVL